jgi:peptidoglycan/LPS O-acetylase OafA/YrhL
MSTIQSLLQFQSHGDPGLLVQHPLLFNVEILVGFAVLLLCRRKDPSSAVVSRNFSDMAKGLAILLIVVHHLCRHALQFPSDLLLYYHFGGIGVSMFLFMSGYGVNESYAASGLDAYFKKKFVKIYVAYVLVNVMFIVLAVNLDHAGYSPSKMAKIALGIDVVDRNHWYMRFLFFWYAAFFFASRIEALREARGVVMVLLGLFVVFSQGMHSNARMNAFAFPLGVLASAHRQWALSFLEKLGPARRIALCVAPAILLLLIKTQGIFAVSTVYRALFALFFAGVFLALKLRPVEILGYTAVVFIGGQFAYQLERIDEVAKGLAYASAGLSVMVAVKKIMNGYVSAPLAWIGRYSLEIFLLHGAFMYTYDFILFRMPLEISFFLYMAFVMVMSVAVRKASGAAASVFAR